MCGWARRRSAARCSSGLTRCCRTRRSSTRMALPRAARSCSDRIPLACPRLRTRSARRTQVELRLVDTNGELASEGELEMRSPGLMNGYHNRPDLVTPITPDGFYRPAMYFVAMKTASTRSSDDVTTCSFPVAKTSSQVTWKRCSSGILDSASECDSRR